MATDRRTITLSVLTEIANQPFQYGRVDCFQIAARVAEAITGKRPGLNFEYDTEAQANDLIHQHGGAVDFISSFVGKPVKDRSALRDGDAALVSLPNHPPVLGVILDRSVYVKTKEALIPVKFSRVIEGWKIG